MRTRKFCIKILKIKNMKQELKDKMLKEIFIQTGGRKENPKIANICAEIAEEYINAVKKIITSKQILSFELALKVNSFIHDKCKNGVPHDIGWNVIQMIKKEIKGKQKITSKK